MAITGSTLEACSQELLTIAERMAIVGSFATVRDAEKQQDFVTGVNNGVNGLGKLRRAASEKGGHKQTSLPQ